MLLVYNTKLMIIVIAEEGERKLIEDYLEAGDTPVVVTGVGAINIIRALQELPRNEHIVNIGYAGSANFSVGSLVEVTDACLNHPCVTYPEPELPIEPCPLPLKRQPDYRARCYSNTDFVLQSDYKDCVFDMELAYIAALGFKKVTALKHVSDNLSLHAYHELTNGVE